MVPKPTDENDLEQYRDYLRVLAKLELDTRLRDKIDSSDIVQQTLIQMVHGIENFRGSTTKEFYGWLNTILRNEIKISRASCHVGSQTNVRHVLPWSRN